MTVTAHNTRYVNRAATKQPLAYVRTVQEKRQQEGWLDCSAAEFVRLLGLHEAGKINLLAMPETAAYVTEESEEPEESEARTTIRRVNAGPPRIEVPALLRVRQVMRRCNAAPLSTAAIAQRTGLVQQSVAYILRTHPDEFECLGRDGRNNLWKRKDGEADRNAM